MKIDDARKNIAKSLAATCVTLVSLANYDHNAARVVLLELSLAFGRPYTEAVEQVVKYMMQVDSVNGSEMTPQEYATLEREVANNG